MEPDVVQKFNTVKNALRSLTNLKPAAADESEVRFEFVEKHSPNLFFFFFVFILEKGALIYNVGSGFIMIVRVRRRQLLFQCRLMTEIPADARVAGFNT